MSPTYVIIGSWIINSFIWHLLITRHCARYFAIYGIFNFYSSPQRLILWENLEFLLYRQGTHINMKLHICNGTGAPPLKCHVLSLRLSKGRAHGWTWGRLVVWALTVQCRPLCQSWALCPQDVNNLFLIWHQSFSLQACLFHVPRGDLLSTPF